MFCENCGNKLKDDAKFCESCGYPVESEKQEKNYSNNGEQMNYKNTKYEKKKSKKFIMVILTIVITVALIILTDKMDDKMGGYETETDLYPQGTFYANSSIENLYNFVNDKVFVEGTVNIPIYDSSAFSIYSMNSFKEIDVVGEFEEYPRIYDTVFVYGTVKQNPQTGELFLEADRYQLINDFE